MNRAIKQPRKGDVLEHGATGLPMTVDEVRNRGQLLVVTMPGRGTEWVERAPQGHWVRWDS